MSAATANAPPGGSGAAERRRQKGRRAAKLSLGSGLRGGGGSPAPASVPRGGGGNIDANDGPVAVASPDRAAPSSAAAVPTGTAGAADPSTLACANTVPSAAEVGACSGQASSSSGEEKRRKPGRPRKQPTNVVGGKQKAAAQAALAARTERATEDQARDQRDEEDRRAASLEAEGVPSRSMFTQGLISGKRRRTNAASELDEEGRRQLHRIWIHRGKRLFRQYADRLRRLKAAKTQVEHTLVRAEILPDLVLPDWRFNEYAADALNLIPRVVKVHWAAWHSARVKLVGERFRARWGGVPAKLLWFFPVAKLLSA